MRTNSIKYLSIYEELKHQISNGIFPLGETFPPEPELQLLYNTSRITVRHAVQLLVDEGYLQRIHGVGTIVVSQKESLQLQTLLSFSEENKDVHSHSEMIAFEEHMVAPPLVCSLLKLPKGETVTYNERLRWTDDICIGLQRVYCPSYIPISEEELGKPNGSLYELLKEKGFLVKSANETIESVIADERLATYLHVAKGSPLLFVQRVTKDQRDRLIEYAEIYYRGDRYRYSVQLKAF